MLQRPRQAPGRVGSTLVETALAMGLCLMIMFGTLEYGRYVMVRQVMQNAAREGARFAVVSVPEKIPAQQIRDKVVSFMGGLHSQLDGFDAQTKVLVYKADDQGNNIGSWDQASFGELIAVEITGNFKPVIPILLGDSLPIRVRAVMYSEAN